MYWCPLTKFMAGQTHRRRFVLWEMARTICVLFECFVSSCLTSCISTVRIIMNRYGDSGQPWNMPEPCGDTPVCVLLSLTSNVGFVCIYIYIYPI